MPLSIRPIARSAGRTCGERGPYNGLCGNVAVADVESIPTCSKHLKRYTSKRGR